ncbi:DUF1659 domain-containing protein [Rummeliibacillus sp. JY-2-4R]
MATKAFEKATLRLKFSLGVNENGQLVEKVKSYQNVSDQTSVDNLTTAGNALASLYSYEFIGTGILTQEIIQN